jgi:hypothetical protein
MKTEILESLVSGIKGSTFISIDTVTPVKLTGGKKNPMQERVTKRVTGSNVQLFTNTKSNAYGNAINRRLTAEGKEAEFSVGPRAWGVRRPNTPFVDHKESVYLEVIFVKSGKVEYLVDGLPFNGVIEGLVNDKIEGEQGGLEDKVILRTYNVDSIQKITINHQTVCAQ